MAMLQISNTVNHLMVYIITILTTFLLQIEYITPLVIHEKFRRFSDLNGYKCHDSNDIFRIDKRASALDCARHCASVPECTGIFYQKDTQQCLGCNSQCNISNTSDILVGSSFYKRYICPGVADWVGLPQGCSLIQFQNQSLSHSDAVTTCESVGAKLVKINERWKMDYISEIIQLCEELSTGEYWVDGSNAAASDFLAPDAWKFWDGSLVPMDNYFWATHAPNSPETHHCFRIVDSLWDDKDCSFPYWFICEK